MTTQQSSHWLNYINGQWVDSDQHLDITDPATGKVFASMACANSAAIDSAVAAAKACVESQVLTKCRPVERAQLMYRIAQEIRNVVDLSLIHI